MPIYVCLYYFHATGFDIVPKIVMYFSVLSLLLLQMGSDKDSDGVNIVEIEDLIHNFLIIMLEHSMRRKDGWKVCFLLIVSKYYDVSSMIL